MKKIHESTYGGTSDNFHVSKNDDTLSVELTYPPRTDEENGNNQCRYVYINQESVRASDGIRVYYDYSRDGFVVQQPKMVITDIEEGNYGMKIETDEEWIEVGFFHSWLFDTWAGEGPPDEEIERFLAERKQRGDTE